jgi:hypothetical protein
MISQGSNVIDLNAILHPGSVYDHPSDVVADPTLSTGVRCPPDDQGYHCCMRANNFGYVTCQSATFETKGAAN